MEQEMSIDKIVALCKRRGFVFPSSEIYGGFSAIYDYGHYGTLLKNNIRDAWWKSMIQDRDDVVGLDSAIFMHPQTWVASGHVDGFNDPQVDCKKCNGRFRADHVLESFGVDADKASIEFINEELNKLREAKKLVCPNCGSADLTEARVFSLMVKSNLGSPTSALSEENVVYLRPETCGGIYLEYLNTLNSTRVRPPFGIAQVGKAFRNEIIARQFIFRTREFEQMEMQYFVHPTDVKTMYEDWKATRMQWFLDLGIDASRVRFHKHEKLAHYASEAYDIEFDFQSLGGFKEVEGIHARGDWDLSQHSKFSGKDLSFFEEKTKERYTPHIVETSVGLNRLMLMMLDFAYTEESVGEDDVRTVLKFPKKLAPIKIAVFPLLKNKPELVAKAREVYSMLKKNWMCEFDDNGNVGKRYRRQDEIGTPYCVTIDFDTIGAGEDPSLNDAVTIRDRDTMKQERVPIAELETWFASRFS
ncbi:glycine--tRNA ligase [Candidatus Uhrbacteria bacterium RIFOXYB2_FULL_45_11]|uniref:glycine--tRNA ligase n=1 Tax=Candidatus Uhrbacteria bacterium RIFOXYB2_FULL_45_11 TaxID=1802421 RepID=A0A1F7W1C5_9BACT|nr:MAG: glycine--tRNA ligase [Candidatus Uhrbacteria bacterium RIFOXYB2_FULL_45_11]